MPSEVQFRRGSESENNNFLGAEGELSVNTTNNALRVHNGIATGGFELAKDDLSNVGIVTQFATEKLSIGNTEVLSLDFELKNISGIDTTTRLAFETALQLDPNNFDNLNVTGVSTFPNVVIGSGTTDLIVNGNARITGILSIGTATITLDPTTNRINVGSQLSIDADAGTITVGSNEIVNSTGDANFSGIVTASNLYSSGPVSAAYYAEPHSVDESGTISIGVAITDKTSNHRYTGVAENSYYFDGIEAPYLNFVPGKTYRFDESDSSVFPHRIEFFTDEARTQQWFEGVTVSNLPKYTEIVVTENTPSVLYYEADGIQSYNMGNQINVISSVAGTGDLYRYKTDGELLTVGIGSTQNPSNPGDIFSILTPGTDYDSLFYVTDPGGTNRIAIYPSSPDSGTNFTDLSFKVNESEAFISVYESNVGVSTQRSLFSIYADQNVIMYGGSSYVQVNNSNGVSIAGFSTNAMYLTSPVDGLKYAHFLTNVSAGGTFNTTIYDNLNITGALSKGSGSFKIDHPLPEKTDTHHLVHSFIEGPKADLIYRGKVDLINGTSSVNIDEVSGMTEGTFVSLCRDVQCFTSNETGWDSVKGSVSGNILTIECQNTNSTDTISWMVVGERKDAHMYEIGWTDENGKIIVEPEKIESASPPTIEILDQRVDRFR